MPTHSAALPQSRPRVPRGPQPGSPRCHPQRPASPPGPAAPVTGWCRPGNRAPGGEPGGHGGCPEEPGGARSGGGARDRRRGGRGGGGSARSSRSGAGPGGGGDDVRGRGRGGARGHLQAPAGGRRRQHRAAPLPPLRSAPLPRLLSPLSAPVLSSRPVPFRSVPFRNDEAGPGRTEGTAALLPPPGTGVGARCGRGGRGARRRHRAHGLIPPPPLPSSSRCCSPARPDPTGSSAPRSVPAGTAPGSTGSHGAKAVAVPCCAVPCRAGHCGLTALQPGSGSPGAPPAAPGASRCPYSSRRGSGCPRGRAQPLSPGLSPSFGRCRFGSLRSRFSSCFALGAAGIRCPRRCRLLPCAEIPSRTPPAAPGPRGEPPGWSSAMGQHQQVGSDPALPGRARLLHRRVITGKGALPAAGAAR